MDDQPPLIWPQFESTGYTRRRSPISTMFVPAMIGVISAAIFLVFVTFVVPTFLSITSQILQPSSVKRGWDSINVVLVFFAILCGVLARRNDDGLSSQSSLGEEEEGGAVTSGDMTVGEDSKISSTPTVSAEHWFDDVYDADRLKIYESVSSRSFSRGLPVTGAVPLRRSSTSYPDMKQGVFSETADRRFRFYDDFEIDMYRSQDYEQYPNRSNTEIEEESQAKEILVDKFIVKPSSPPPQSQQPPVPPPPPPPPVEVFQKPRRTHRSVRNRDIPENTKRSDTKFKRAFHPPPSPPPPTPPTPPPPPSPPPLITATPPRKQGTLQRRKSNAAKEIKMVFASLYNQGKRKKKFQKPKRKERIESSPVMVDVMEPPPQYQSLIPPPSPPPPPPPPPPPRSSQSVFYGLFKKGAKGNKKIHSVPAPPPPPRKIQFDPQTPPRRVKSGRPPLPKKPTNVNEENNGQGSPLIQITPPPPPPPPFRVPPLKFVVSGDFAKIRSNQSSRCSSPEREVFDIGWGLELTQSDSGAETKSAVGCGGGPGFCPSPDVNTKADNFIARLRDEWRLDKINSSNRKR